MTEYCYGIDYEKGMRWQTYVASINGTDPNYILHRDFRRVHTKRTWYGHSCYIELCNGLYEVAIIRIDEETGERVRRERWWIIVVDDDIYDYEFDEINWQYALYTSFLIKLNFGEQESTLKLEA